MMTSVMQFDVQTVKLPSSICEKQNILSCQVPNSSSPTEEVIRSYGQCRQKSDVSDNELIIPKKLTNPCIESLNHQHLHKELLFNNKM